MQMYVAQTVENQEVFWTPCNDDTKTIQYDTKFLKSSPGRYPAIKWSVTKIEDTVVEGISRFTMAQTQFDSSKDNVELGIADYYDSAVRPEIPETEEIPTVSDLEIIYSGKPAVRAGGGFKKLMLKERINGQLEEVKDGVEWFVDFPDGEKTDIETSENGGVFKVKCTNNYSLIGKTFTVTAKTKNSSKSIMLEVISI